jgi:hypothetical protein
MNRPIVLLGLSGACLLGQSCTERSTSREVPQASLPPAAAPVSSPSTLNSGANTEAPVVAAPHVVAAPAPTATAALAVLAPVLVAKDGTSLPQTEQRPTFDSPWLQASVKRLFEAFIHDDPQQAKDFFFPKVAYAQVKAIADPDRDWENRLQRAFAREVHEYHLALGSDRAEATFVELRADPKRVRWVKPGEEGNRVGYFRILRSVLVYKDKQGRTRELGLRSMISWRGEWYLVHLARI